MVRVLLWILAAILLGGIVHLSTVLAMPQAAKQDAYSRLVPLTPVNAMVQLTAPTTGNAIMPFMDPAFAQAVCRYDLSSGSLKLIAPVSQAYTSVTFYTRKSVAYYAINDRAAGRRTIELDLMTPEQHAEVPEEEDVTAADRLIIEFAEHDGTDRAAGAGAGTEPDADGARRACRRDLRHSAGAIDYFGAAPWRAATASRRIDEARDFHGVGFDLLLQFGQQPIRFCRRGLRLGDREMFKREAITGATLVERIMHPGDRQGVLADARLRVDAFGWRERSNVFHARLPPPVEIDDVMRDREERLDAHDVVADIVDDLVVTRRARAQQLALQMPIVGGRIERP